MKKILNWKKGIFKDTYRIFSGEIQVGELKDKPFAQSATGKLNLKKYKFKTKGFFKQKTDIVDLDDNTVVGKITYNSWMTKANITYADKVVYWKYHNIWNTKWSVFDSDRIQINFQGSCSKGTIEMETQNELWILTGLYIINYYRQITIAVFLTVFIPAWVTLFN